MGKVLPISDHDNAKQAAVEAILAGKLVVYPTDTLYGIGCNAKDAKAVEKVRAAKGRDSGKPLSILVSDYKMLLEYCEVSSAQEHILHALLPGPYTFILPLRSSLPVSATGKIGVRVPEHILMRKVSEQAGVPIVSTSANLSGRKEPASLSEVDRKIMSAVDLVIDGGTCKYAQGSTIIDLVEMKVVRKGAVREGDKFHF